MKIIKDKSLSKQIFKGEMTYQLNVNKKKAKLRKSNFLEKYLYNQTDRRFLK